MERRKTTTSRLIASSGDEFDTSLRNAYSDDEELEEEECEVWYRRSGAFNEMNKLGR